MRDNKRQNLKLFCKKDIFPAAILLFIIFIISAVFFTNAKKAEATHAEVSVDGNVFLTIDLSANSEYSEIPIDNEYNTVIAYEKNKIWIKSSGCENQICVNTGKISVPGSSIVCIPARLVITVKGADSTDARTY